MTDTPKTDYPFGNGDPNCPVCKGRGVVPFKPEKPSHFLAVEATQNCKCTVVRDIRANMERGWAGLSGAPLLPGSKLRGYEAKNLWITTSTILFKVHLRHIAARMGPRWGFKVVSDADLMDAWLAPDLDVRDGDVDQMRKYKVTGGYGMLVDMVEPPELLIIFVGIKAARNSAMPEVLLEAIAHRLHISRPTWVVDQPHHRLVEGHLSYSEHVIAAISDWPHATLGIKRAVATVGDVLPVQFFGGTVPENEVGASEDAIEGEPEADDDTVGEAAVEEEEGAVENGGSRTRSLITDEDTLTPEERAAAREKAKREGKLKKQRAKEQALRNKKRGQE